MAAPATPTGLTAQALPGRIRITWNAVSNADNYRIARMVAGGSYSIIVNATVETNYIDTAVTAGTIYRYAVSASNADGRSPGVQTSYVTALSEDVPEIILQQNRSERNHMVKDTVNIFDTAAYFKAETSIIDPTFLLNVSYADIAAANYMTVPALRRSYFITGVTVVRTGLVEVSGHVDVLASFANEIKANSGIVRRSESAEAYNLYIDDGSLVSYGDPYILTEPFPSGFSGHTFILAAAGAT